MMKNIGILDKEYLSWIKSLTARYRQSQIKAAIKVNQEVLHFYWELGHDIVERNAENQYGSKFYATLSRDLKHELQINEGFSERNLRYTKKFYLLYNEALQNLQQVAANSERTLLNKNLQQLAANSKISEDRKESHTKQFCERLFNDLFVVPWGHHMLIIDKCSNNPEKAIFYIQQTVENGWSRAMLLNFLGTNLYERSGKAVTNFNKTLPEETSELAQELTKDPYNFAFTGITGIYNERLLKDALLNNITKFLIELGTGFAYVGKEYRLHIGETEKFIDLLFYNLNLSCYVVIEVKIGKFEFADVGQLGGYVVACNHLLRKEGRDNPTIGLLVCKEKDRILAQYSLESSSQPIGISEYDLEKFYPEKLEGTIPSIEEIEAKLSEKAEGGEA